VIAALRQMRKNGWLTLDVKPDAQASYNQSLQSKSAKAVWESGCASWYLTENGRNTTLWPDFTFRFRQITRRFDSGAYRVESRGNLEQEPGAASSVTTVAAGQR
jgi:hypothetical protein